MLYPLNKGVRGAHSRCCCDVQEVNWSPSQESNHDFSDFECALYLLHPAFKYANLVALRTCAVASVFEKCKCSLRISF